MYGRFRTTESSFAAAFTFMEWLWPALLAIVLSRS
jgi:hypothetical protein